MAGGRPSREWGRARLDAPIVGGRSCDIETYRATLGHLGSGRVDPVAWLLDPRKRISSREAHETVGMKARRDGLHREKVALPRDLARHFEASRRANREALDELAKH